MGLAKSGLAWATIVIAAVVFNPDSVANCGLNKVFRSAGPLAEDVRISPGYPRQGVEHAIGRWWNSSDYLQSNNFAGANAGTCDSVHWWLEIPSGNKYISGVLDDSTLGCVGYTGCPGDEMTIVVEDYGPAGPSSVADTAYWVGFRVDDTPATLRRYDYGRTDNGVEGNSVFPFLEFPSIVLRYVARHGVVVELEYDLLDQSEHVHTASGSADTPLATDSVVAEYHFMIHTGTGDPGRLREGNWELVRRIPYEDGNVTAQYVSVLCTDTINDEYLAIGLGFDGGTGIIPSALVGPAIFIECDPNLATPDRPTAVAQPADSRPTSRIRR